jgi:hypothetical protein
LYTIQNWQWKGESTYRLLSKAMPTGMQGGIGDGSCPAHATILAGHDAFRTLLPNSLLPRWSEAGTERTECGAAPASVLAPILDSTLPIPAASPRDRDSYARQSALSNASCRYEVLTLAEVVPRRPRDARNSLRVGDDPPGMWCSLLMGGHFVGKR